MHKKRTVAMSLKVGTVLVRCWHLSIFPGRHQPSIFDTSELNFRVRNGNGCTLAVINTNYFFVVCDLSQRRMLL